MCSLVVTVTRKCDINSQKNDDDSSSLLQSSVIAPKLAKLCPINVPLKRQKLHPTLVFHKTFSTYFQHRPFTSLEPPFPTLSNHNVSFLYAPINRDTIIDKIKAKIVQIISKTETMSFPLSNHVSQDDDNGKTFIPSKTSSLL